MSVALVPIAAHAPARGQAAIIIDENTTIDTYINDAVHIVPGDDPPTVVTVAPGGYMSGTEVFGSSILNISGGHCHGTANDTSIVNVYSGEMEFITKDATTVDFFDGYSEVSGADDFSTWHVTGGTIDFFHALGSSTAYFSDGHQYMLIGHDTSTIHVSGGLVEMLRSGDPDGSGFQGPDSNVIFIAGGPFNYPYGRIPDATGQLQGVLASGEPIDATFEIYDQASIVLVPEPSSLVLLGLGAVNLLWLARRHRRATRL